MHKNNYYLVCKKGFLGRLSPLKILTSLKTAIAFAAKIKNGVVLKQAPEGSLELISNEDDK